MGDYTKRFRSIIIIAIHSVLKCFHEFFICKTVSILKSCKKKNPTTLGESIYKADSLATFNMVTVCYFSTVVPPYPWIQLLRTQLRVGNTWGKKVSESSKKQNLKLPHAVNYLHGFYTVFTTICIVLNIIGI